MAPGRSPASAKASITPVRNASDGSAGVLGVFARQSCPVVRSASVTSVNVPPISTATTRSGDRINVPLAMERLRRWSVGTQRGGGVLLHCATGDRHAVIAPRRRDRDKTVVDVLQHAVSGPVERMAIAAATACL